MTINFNYETANLTEQERLEVRKQLKEKLDELDMELGLIPNSTFFFGIPFDVSQMSRKELDSVQRDVTLLLANVLMWLEDLPLKHHNTSMYVFDTYFQFDKMSYNDLWTSKKDCLNLVQLIAEEKDARNHAFF